MEHMSSKGPTQQDDPVGYLALQLAMTRDLGEENALKQVYHQKGIAFAVTEIGGKSDGDFQDKINRAVIGASLNHSVVEKSPGEIHALLHATEEAKRGVLVNATSNSSIVLKLAIVRAEGWIAVAMYGESSIHPLSRHERCGLGIMHI